jgi:hypothetical protein
MSPVDGNFELFAIGAGGQGLRRLTTSAGSELTPCWGVVREPTVSD